MQKFAIIQHIPDGLVQVLAEYLEVGFVFGWEYGIFIDAGQVTCIENGEIVLIGGYDLCYHIVAFINIVERHSRYKYLHFVSGSFGGRDDEDAGGG